MTADEELDELREATERGDRLQEDARHEATAAFRKGVVEMLNELEAGERQKTVSVWDGGLAAFVGALEETGDLEPVGVALQETLNQEADPNGIDRSEVLRLALRLGFREAAPEYLDAAREVVQEEMSPDL